MQRKSLKKKEFDQLRKLMENDATFKEVVQDLAESADQAKSDRRELRVPYVNAPSIAECAWK